MKIIVVQDWLRSGGTERQSVLLANAFADAGLETTLLTFRPGGRLDATVAGKVRRVALQPFDLGLDWFAPRLSAIVRRLQPDVVLCMGRMANCYAGKLQQTLPAATVIGTMRTGKALPPRFRRSLQEVRHVVANSQEARETLIGTYSVAPEKIDVIYNSLVFPPEPDDAARTQMAERRAQLRSRLGASERTLALLCVAMFRPEKNQRELIEIVAGFDGKTEWQLWLAGDGRARAGCEALARETKLSDRVKFVGFHPDPTALYAAADVAVHASWSESLSNFLIEAQAHGLPAIAYEAQGIRECFRPDRTGWAIARDDRDAFRNRIVRLMDDSIETRSARAAEARHYARSTFDAKRQIEAYLALFERLQRAR